MTLRSFRRARGALLRLARQRPVAVTVGAALLAPAVWLWTHDYRWESGVTDGLMLVLGATGAAFLLVGVTGRHGDWVDPDSPRGNDGV